MMSNRIGCQLSDMFKAIVPHSGGLTYGDSFSSCQPEVGLLSSCRRWQCYTKSSPITFSTLSFLGHLPANFLTIFLRNQRYSLQLQFWSKCPFMEDIEHVYRRSQTHFPGKLKCKSRPSQASIVSKWHLQSATTNCTAWSGCGVTDAFVEMCWITGMGHWYVAWQGLSEHHVILKCIWLPWPSSGVSRDRLTILPKNYFLWFDYHPSFAHLDTIDCDADVIIVCVIAGVGTSGRSLLV